MESLIPIKGLRKIIDSYLDNPLKELNMVIRRKTYRIKKILNITYKNHPPYAIRHLSRVKECLSFYSKGYYSFCSHKYCPKVWYWTIRAQL